MWLSPVKSKPHPCQFSHICLRMRPPLKLCLAALLHVSPPNTHHTIQKSGESWESISLSFLSCLTCKQVDLSSTKAEMYCSTAAPRCKRNRVQMLCSAGGKPHFPDVLKRHLEWKQFSLYPKKHAASKKSSFFLSGPD